MARAKLSIFLCSIILCGTFSAFAKNLSADKKTFASSSLDGHAPSKAVDGIIDPDNGWGSVQIEDKPEYMNIDLEKKYQINNIEITFGRGGADPQIPSEFSVKIDDGSGKFQEVDGFSVSGNKSSDVKLIPTKDLKASRVHLECTKQKEYCIVQEIVVNGSSIDHSSDVNFGGNWQGMKKEDTVTLQEAAGVTYVRASVTLPNFNGKSGELDYNDEHGQKYLLNVSAEEKDKFARDIPKFQERLTSLLDVYKPEVLVVENEPATLAFYDDDLDNYIAELKAAIEVAKKYNVKVSDGALHVECIQAMMAGMVKQGTVCDRQQYLLDQYAKIPDLNYITLHFYVGGDGLGNGKDGFPKGVLQDVSDYIKDYTGHNVISNEWHVEDDSQILMDSLISEFRKTNDNNNQFKYSIMYSGDGTDKSLPFNKLATLNKLGGYFRDAIASEK